MTERFYSPVIKYTTSQLKTLPGALLYFYETGTSTPKTTWSDPERQTESANPVEALADGTFPPIFINGIYRVELKNADGVTQPGWPVDDVGTPSTGAPFQEWSSTYSYSEDDIVTYGGDFYISLNDNNVGNIPSSSPSKWQKKILLDAPAAESYLNGNSSGTYDWHTLAQTKTNLSLPTDTVSDLLARVQTIATIADLTALTGMVDGQQFSIGEGGVGGTYYVATGAYTESPPNVYESATAGTYFIRADQDTYKHHPLINSIATTTVYCNPVTGDDVTGDGTLANPWQTFQKAVDMCPRILTHQYIIDLITSPTATADMPAIYAEDVLIRDIHAPMTNPATPLLISSGLRVIGAGTDYLTDDPLDVQVNSLTISGCTGIANPEIYGMYANTISPYYEELEYFAIYGTQEAQLYNVACSGAGGSGKAVVRAYGSGLSLKGVDCTGAAHVCWAKRGAYGVVSDAHGTADSSTVLIRSEEASNIALISYSAVTGLTDQRNVITYNYGLTYDGVGILRVRGTYYGFPKFGTTLGTDSLGLGYNFDASGAGVVSVGLNNVAGGVSGTSIGAGASSGTQSNNTALGAAALTAGSGGNVGRRATALGAAASSAFENATALGYNAATVRDNSVRLGNSSVVAVETQSAYEVLGAGGIVYLRSPDNTRYAITVSNAGAIVVTAAP